MTKPVSSSFFRPSFFTSLIVVAALVATTAKGADEDEGERHQFTYAWSFEDPATLGPRGGTSTGPAVVLDAEPSGAWRALQEPGISKLERDRRAILAMAGPYRTSFDFIETVGFVEDFTPDRPYQSWGTEYIYVVADEPAFISLQHILVMFFELPDGQVSDAAVVKHWRQDWHYEDRDMHVYAGHNRWARQTLSRQESRGTWTQAVFQVDDSPRYEGFGTWEHDGNHSSWQSNTVWRPLPRREFSVRDNYHVLQGTNRHTITPTGWVQEEDNLKVVLDESGQPVANLPFLAREAGLARYERIVDHDFSAGDAYWEATAPFWADVRNAWEDIFGRRDTFTVNSEVDGERLFEAMFEYAGRLEDAEYDARDAQGYVEATLERFIE